VTFCNTNFFRLLKRFPYCSECKSEQERDKIKSRKKETKDSFELVASPLEIIVSRFFGVDNNDI